MHVLFCLLKHSKKKKQYKLNCIQTAIKLCSYTNRKPHNKNSISFLEHWVSWTQLWCCMLHWGFCHLGTPHENKVIIYMSPTVCSSTNHFCKAEIKFHSFCLFLFFSILQLLKATVVHMYVTCYVVWKFNAIFLPSLSNKLKYSTIFIESAMQHIDRKVPGCVAVRKIW